jgi:hypothetical protein
MSFSRSSTAVLVLVGFVAAGLGAAASLTAGPEPINKPTLDDLIVPKEVVDGAGKDLPVDLGPKVGIPSHSLMTSRGARSWL